MVDFTNLCPGWSIQPGPIYILGGYIVEKYSPQSIEKKWQSKWLAENVYKTEMDPEKPKYYSLEMFPYPSGNLHMGHVRNYSIGDVLARYKTMEGFNVIHPMGFDAFGMPAENAAIKHGVKPSDWTYSNMDNMKRQQREMGLSYDWDRAVATCSPDYYRWTQWLFQLFYKRGLAYKKKAYVNWCDTCGTVLANMQPPLLVSHIFAAFFDGLPLDTCTCIGSSFSFDQK